MINTVVYMTLVYDYSMITALAAGEISCFDLEITIVKLENVFFFSKWTCFFLFKVDLYLLQGSRCNSNRIH